MSEISTLISTLGFPIVMCIALFWFCYHLVEKMSTVISENTTVVLELKTMIESMYNNVLVVAVEAPEEETETDVDTDTAEEEEL